MSFKVVIPKPTFKAIEKIPNKDRIRIFDRLLKLEENPYPTGSQKLKGYDDQYRLRVGDYRVRYFINLTNKEVVILDVAHRKEIYKKK